MTPLVRLTNDPVVLRCSPNAERAGRFPEPPDAPGPDQVGQFDSLVVFQVQAIQKFKLYSFGMFHSMHKNKQMFDKLDLGPGDDP